MKVLVAVLALPLLGASAPDAEEREADEPTLEAEADFSDMADRNCHDTIRTVREENGQPLFQRDTADPDEPILFYALDHEVDGCDVLLVSRDGDVRDMPSAPEGPVRVQPAQ